MSGDIRGKETSSAAEFDRQGTTLLGMGKYDEAIEYFEKSAESDQMYEESYLHLGIAYMALKRYDEAKSEFEKSLMVKKNYAPAFFHLGNLAVINNDFQKGIQNYNKAVAYGYDEAEIYFDTGLAYEQLGDNAMAIRNYTKAAAKNPLRQEYSVRKAQLCVVEKRYEEAMETLEELNIYCPDSFDGYHMRFEILAMQGKYEEAGEIIDSAIKKFPGDVSLVLDKVRLYRASGDFDAALGQIESAEKMECGDGEKRGLVFEKAKIYALKKDTVKSIHILESLKRLEKEDRPDIEGRCFLINGYISLKDYTKALSETEELLSLPGESAYQKSALYYKPYCLKMLGRTDEAEKLFREAERTLRLDTISQPANINYYMLRVLCHEELKEYDKALDLINYILMLKPDNAEAHSVKSRICKDMGDDKKAEMEKDMVKQMNPKFFSQIDWG